MAAYIADKPLATGICVLLLAVFTGSHAQAGVIDPELEPILQASKPGQVVPVILTLNDRVDLSAFKDLDRQTSRTGMIKALKSKADARQQGLKALLTSRRVKNIRQLWLINGMAFNANSAVIREIANRPDVDSVRLDQTVEAPAVNAGVTAAPEWNLGAIHIPEVWSLGYTGAGMVVANIDTGVDVQHPDLGGKWRGGLNSWYDPHGEHATPYDNLGHGTQTMGIMVGGEAGGTSIGVVPGAKWIAAKLFNDAGQAQWSDIHLSFQWLLDPDGDPNTADMPHVVNASWGLVGSANQCVLEFNDDIQTLKFANIAVVFSGGNEGPASQTSVSPANNPEGFAIGAVNDTQTLANFSSRGAGACDGGIYPRISAPGVNINTADLSFGGLPLYASVSGTSFAAPHISGTMALLLNAFPNTSIASLESALQQSALDLGESGADNGYGYGLANALAAYHYLRDSTPSGNVPIITSTPVTTAAQGQAYLYSVTASDPDGDLLSFSLITAPLGMNIDAKTGLIAWTPSNAQVGGNSVALKVSDPGGLFATQSFSIQVTNVNDPPVAGNDAYGMISGGTLAVAEAGVLDNDSDLDGDALTALQASGPAKGSLSLNPSGGFVYTPVTGFAGTDTFTYLANDGALSSPAATVTITVNPNQAPIAGNDVATTRKNTAKVIAVLANDSDPDGSLNPASATLVQAPNKGGITTINAGGTVTYKPKQNFRGTESFSYTVKDDRGATSNKATVTVTVTN
jgi:subtilisin family serine protease